MQPAFTGPFKVLRCTRGGSYQLLNTLNELHPTKVPPSHIKLISHKAGFINKAAENPFEVLKVVDHRGAGANVEYRVRWKGYSAQDDTWQKVVDFNSTNCIDAYWLTHRPQKIRAGSLFLPLLSPLSEMAVLPMLLPVLPVFPDFFPHLLLLFLLHFLLLVFRIFFYL